MNSVVEILKSGLCPSTFTPISATEFVHNLNPGWNLGNTLDAIPDEGSWNNPLASESVLDDVKAAGFRSVRIPVTYADHFVDDESPWTINVTWLERVSRVIDMATSTGLYVITNMHHDSWRWADVTKPSANISRIESQFYASWLQIGRALRCKSSMVAFEPLNEPPADTDMDGSHINRLNDLFIQALSDSGGHNSERVVTLVGGGEDAEKTVKWFSVPGKMTNPWVLQFHYYSPYDFIFSAWGKTTWGDEADRNAVVRDLGAIRNHFGDDVPLVVGEFSASPTNCEAAARWQYTDFLVQTAHAMNMSTMLWDNGADNLDRRARAWRDPTSIRILMRASTGEANSLPVSTATTGSSSAFLFHHVGSPIVEQTLLFTSQGRLDSISCSTGVDGQPDRKRSRDLSSSSDYRVSGTQDRLLNVTFTESFLSSLIVASETAGKKANLTLVFSDSAPVVVEVVQWDVPVLSSLKSKAVPGQDLSIPVAYRGLERLAAVKMARTNGSYLVDSWTHNLGPLQQGRGTFNKEWNFDDSHVIITVAAVEAVVAGSVPAIFSFEFYPRQPENVVNYTLFV